MKTLRKIKKVTALMSCFSTCLSLNRQVFTKHAYGADIATKDNALTKVSSEVYEIAPDEDGKVQIYINRTSLPQENVDDVFYEKYGFSVSDYEDEEKYQSKVVPRVAAKATATHGKKSVDMSAGIELYDDEISPLDYMLSEDCNDFIMKKRSVIKELYLKYNGEFLKNHNIDESDVVYNGWYTGSFILRADMEQIKKIAMDDSVLEIALCKSTEAEPAMTYVHEQIGTDDATGTKSSGYSSGSGYKGFGVKIGIIEAKKGRFDPDAPQLASIVGTQLFYIENKNSNGSINPSILPHSTLVTSIIVGQKVTVDGVTYEGIVPKATVYQTSVYYDNDVTNAMKILIDKGVSIINYSGGMEASDATYSWLDREVDELLADKGLYVTFVVSAGNSADAITSPGKAYNAITVGNAETKDEKERVLSSPYAMEYTSSYKEANYLTNKPDVSAPGTYIGCVDKPGHVYRATGTSFSAPIVAGIIAQLHWKASFRTNPTRSKALVLVGADSSKISASGDTAKDPNGRFRDKSGAGLVNAVRTLETALSYHCTTYSFELTDPKIAYKPHAVTLKAEQTIRVVMTFNKPEDITLTKAYENNVDLYIVDKSQQNELAKSKSINNNVEILEYTPSADGTYFIEVLVEKNTVSGKTLDVSIAWIISDNKTRVIFDANGGTCTTHSQEVYKGQPYGTLPVPTRSGYTFAGWFKEPSSGGNEITASSTVTNSTNHILYARWTKVYKIRNIATQKYLNIYGDNLTSLHNDINVTLWSDSGTNEQKWLIPSLGNQQYIRSVIDNSYGLNVYRSGDPYNCNIRQIIGNETDAQIDFRYMGTENTYLIKLHNYNLYLTATSSSDGANVYWASPAAGSVQLWSLDIAP